MMLNDTDKTFSELHADGDSFRTAMLDIQKYSTDRQGALPWIDHMRFLAPMTLQSNVDEQMALQDTRTGDAKPRAECVCMDIPAFQPGQRRFRLTNADELNGCQHYVAVSYCWDRSAHHQDDIDASVSYFVETGTGLRRGNVPVDVIDRAVAFAARHQIGLIWIDQDVIDQDEAVEKARAIQVMDIVYERSLWPVAILDTTIVTQDQVNVLDYVFDIEELWKAEEDEDDGDEDEDDGKEEREKETEEQGWNNGYTSKVVIDALELLELLSADRYFTRSWTLQESLSALNMRVLIRVLPSIDIPPQLANMHYAGDICLAMTDLGFALETFASRLELSYSNISQAKSLQSRIEHFNYVISPVFVEAPSQRVSRSAAEVLAILETRSNTILSDRLAIIANLCAYEKRLDTIALDRLTTHGFSTAILVLSLMNGDMTLLNGYDEESFGELQTHLGPRRPQSVQTIWQRDKQYNAEPFGWGWGPPDRGRLHSLPYYETRVFDTQLLRISPAVLIPPGLLTSGFLWKKRNKIDFQILKLKYKYKQGDLVDGEIAKAIKWEALRSLARRNYWELSEALWRFQCYDGNFFKQGEKGFRPYTLTDVLDPKTCQLKNFGDPDIRNSSDFDLLFRRKTTSWWLQYSVAVDGYVTGWSCDSDSANDKMPRAAFDPSTEDFEDQQNEVFVFTPFIQSERGQFDISPEYAIMSWVVSRTNDYYDGVEVLACKGKVEGFWDLDGQEARPFILS